MNNDTFRTDRGLHLTLVSSSTQSKLFVMFMKGCERRMGRLVKQNVGISLELLRELLLRLEEGLMDENVTEQRKRELVVGGVAFVILWVGALRGGEVLLLEASELVKRRNDGRDLKDNDHVVVPLMGRFKGETGERNLLLVLANETGSGIETRKWIKRLIGLLIMEGKHLDVGPAICDSTGLVYSMHTLNTLLYEMLEAVQIEKPQLIPKDVVLADTYNVYRSF